MDFDELELTFTGEVWYWRGPSPYHFVTVPDEAAAAIRAVSSLVTYGWGMIPVHLRTGRTAWRTALWPKDGGYVVPIKDAVRTAEGIAEGDPVELELTVRR